jgi:hypothetical protein
MTPTALEGNVVTVKVSVAFTVELHGCGQCHVAQKYFVLYHQLFLQLFL